MKKKMLIAGGLMASAASAFADGSTSTAVPAAVTSAITDLETAAGNYATAILPYIAAVGLAFIGISVVYLLFKVFKRFVSGK